MKALRLVAAIALALLTVALIVGVLKLHAGGGRMEVAMRVFGDPVWLTVDAGRPRFLLLLLVPGACLAAATALLSRR